MVVHKKKPLKLVDPFERWEAEDGAVRVDHSNYVSKLKFGETLVVLGIALIILGILLWNYL